MAVEIKVPALGESVTEATVAKWLKKVGDAVAIDEPLCELETDKVTVEVNALGRRHASPISPSRKAPRSRSAPCSATSRRAQPAPLPPRRSLPPLPPAPPRRSPLRRRRARLPRPRPPAPISPPRARPRASWPRRRASPPRRSQPTGKDGRVTKGDVLAALDSVPARSAPAAKPAAPAGPRAARRARGARADDAAAPHHRRAPEGGAEHRRHAHHLQRGGHDRRAWRCASGSRRTSRRSTACGWASCRSS